MRILLTATASYAPPRGGATRSNLVWLSHLAAAGHECRVVCGAPGEGAPFRRHESIGLLEVEDPAQRVQALRRQIAEFQPDWVLASSEDLGHALLREAHHSAEGRVVYLAHTPQFFPFGPASWNPERHAAELVARSAGVVAIGCPIGRIPRRRPPWSTWRARRRSSRSARRVGPPSATPRRWWRGPPAWWRSAGIWPGMWNGNWGAWRR